jgi:hypothetical protein
MTPGAEQRAAASDTAGTPRTPGWPLLPVLALIVGIAISALGVALNENGMSAGRAFIIGGLPIAAAGLLFALLRRDRGERAVAAPVRSASATLAEAATHLGLVFEEPPEDAPNNPRRAVGRMYKRRVELSTDAADTTIAVRACVVRKLDMGLSVTRGRLPGDARKEIVSGDAAFDAAYAVRVDEPARGTHLLTERLRTQLMSASAQLDDEGVLLFLQRPDLEELIAGIRQASKVAAELDRTSGHVPCAESMREAQVAWLAFAQQRNLASANTPLAMWGEIQGISVSAVAMRDAFQHYHFELSADFPAPLGRGLALKPASSSTQFARSGEPVGHPAFDKIFIIKANDPVDAARLMGPETRDAILQLREWGLQMRAHDGGLWAWVGLNKNDLELVPRGLYKMALIAASVLRNHERFPARS